MTGATAEEMAVPPSQFITSTRVPYLPWTGFYVGINGGFAWGNSSVTFSANDPAALAGTCGVAGSPKGQCINSVDFRRDGAVAGGQFGFNWQVNSHWLVGAEADYQWSNLDGSVSSSFRLGNVGTTNMVASQTVDSFGTVRARAGVVLAPPLLLYGFLLVLEVLGADFQAAHPVGFEEQRDVGGIVLQVAVHGDDVLSAGMVESGGEASGLAKITAQLDHGYAAVDGGNLAQQLESAVDRTVIDQHHLESLAARFHHGLQPRVEVGDVLLLVVERNYDGVFEHGDFYYTQRGVLSK